MFGSIPFFGFSVYKNPHVRDLLFSGWTPIIVAMLISSGAGLVLERYVEQYKGLAMLTPILCGTVYLVLLEKSFLTCWL
jgi:solute carrier family 41